MWWSGSTRRPRRGECYACLKQLQDGKTISGKAILICRAGALLSFLFVARPWPATLLASPPKRTWRDGDLRPHLDCAHTPFAGIAQATRIDLPSLIHDYRATSTQAAMHDYATRAGGRSSGLVPRLRYEGPVRGFACAFGGTHSVCRPAGP